MKGGATHSELWFVGMVPRRNPELVIVVLQEHGDWGANSAQHRPGDRHDLRE